MALEHTPTMSVEEYFRLEENNPDTRYEYLDEDVVFEKVQNNKRSGK